MVSSPSFKLPGVSAPFLGEFPRLIKDKREAQEEYNNFVEFQQKERSLILYFEKQTKTEEAVTREGEDLKLTELELKQVSAMNEERLALTALHKICYLHKTREETEMDRQYLASHGLDYRGPD